MSARLSDAALARTPDDPQLRLRRELEAMEPGLRIVAEDVLALSSTIDLVGVDSHGRAVLIWIAGPGADLAAFTRALAGSSWAAPRLRDWAQLSPSLKLRPESGVRTLLVCSDFDPETVAAAASLEAGLVELVRWTPLEDDLTPGLLAWLPAEEPVGRPSLPTEDAPRGSPQNEREPVETPPFRSGLSEADLALSAEERQEFE